MALPPFFEPWLIPLDIACTGGLSQCGGGLFVASDGLLLSTGGIYSLLGLTVINPYFGVLHPL